MVAGASVEVGRAHAGRGGGALRRRGWCCGHRPGGDARDTERGAQGIKLNPWKFRRIPVGYSSSSRDGSFETRSNDFRDELFLLISEASRLPIYFAYL